MLCEGMGHGNGLGGRRQSRHARDPLAALLSVALAQRSRGILRFANGNGLTPRLVLTRIPELHLWQTFLNFEGSRASSREPLYFCAICEQPKQQLEADFTQNSRKQSGRS